VSEFGWIAEQYEPPRQWDLRRIGWTLSADTAGGHVRLVDARAGDAPVADGDPSLWVFVGVECGRKRARLLDAGCGDALPASIELRELAERARRVAAARARVPRR